jgi:hypothetical protein
MVPAAQLQEFPQARQVLLQERRQLEQHRPRLRQAFQTRVQVGDRIGGRIRLQPRVVGDARAALMAKRKSCGNRSPSAPAPTPWHLVEGIVDLDRGQVLRRSRPAWLRA